MKIETVLLGLLGMRACSGYDLLKWFEVEGKWIRSGIHHSQIYRALGRLQADGWVGFEVDPREGTPDAKVYRLTDTGRAALLDWVRSPYEPSSRFQDPECRVRISLAAAYDLGAAIATLETELAYRREQVAANRDRDRGPLGVANAIPEFDAAHARLAAQLNHEYGMAAVDQWIDWVSATLAALQKEASR